MSIIELGEKLYEKKLEILKWHNKRLKKLLEKIIDIFKEWCESINDPEQIKELLWGISHKLNPFNHKIKGKFPDLTIGKELNQKGYGIDGLLEIKHKARRIYKEDLIDYIVRNDYLKYIEYCMKKVNDSVKILDFLRYLRRLNNFFEEEIIKKELLNTKTIEFNLGSIKLCKLYSDEKFDKILTFLVDISLDWLKKLLSPPRMPDSELKNTERVQFHIDLHLHSHYSDCGGQSVGEIMCKSNKIGIKTISLTDHNSFDGVLKAIKIGLIFNIKVIPGIEVATGINNNNKWVEERRDILVYFPNVEIFKNWALNGFDSYTNSLLNNASDRSHNKKLWGNVPVNNVLEWATIHKGVTVLAHFGYYNYETYEKIVKLWKIGLKGIELFSLKYTNYKHYAKNSLEEVIELFFDMVKEYAKYYSSDKKPIFTFGSDSHGSESIGNISVSSGLIFKILSFYLPSEPIINIKINPSSYFDQLILDLLDNSI